MTKSDLDLFWKNDALAHEENCFSSRASQVALGIRMSDECVYAELGEEGDPWALEDPVRRFDLNRRYNDIAEETVGKRLLDEIPPELNIPIPPIKRIGEVFGGEYKQRPGTGEWLESPVGTAAELEEMLDRVDRLDLQDFMFFPGWDALKTELLALLSENGMEVPQLYRHVRGPVTLASSIFGVENLIFLYYDAPELFERFGQTIGRVIIEMAEIFDRETGCSAEKFRGGFSFADDDCCLLTPEMYELFAAPVLKSVFERFSPEEGQKRFQHSDSSMAHLLPQLAEMNLTGCNFGPTVLVEDIRKYMPRTRIDGCLSPFTFMSNDKQAIIREVKRDVDALRATGSRGLNIFTAGSINNGSLLSSMRVIMETIAEYGQF